MNAILVALGKRDPADVAPTPQPKAQPLEELVLELTDLKFHEQDGVRRASARARLVHEPATPGQREVASAQSWRLVAPLGPIEAEDPRWYLEKYAIWPSHYFRDRARKVEADLVKWGRLLHEAAMPVAHTANVMQAWAKLDGHAGRRFSVHVDAATEAGAPEADIQTAREAATELLKVPWELLHDGEAFLFQGAKPARVRRRLPNTKVLDVPVVATPIRILLVTARPEDDACGYIDHRASALPLVEAMESLPGLVQLHILSPPTLAALGAELDRAREEKKPYHVVHFDGHGVYDRTVGLGGLCFELPEDIGKLERRRHITIFTSELGPLLRDHRIPLVFLEACQTAQAEKASESVAPEMLKVGVASVVAMQSSVLVETARRFVEAFYQALAGGRRVGDAMLAGQRRLKDDSFRGRVFGADALRLEDWFVPVLFQEKDEFSGRVRRDGTGDPAGRARAARTGDAARGGQHGKRPAAALPQNARGAHGGSGPRACGYPRPLRAAASGGRDASRLHQPRSAARALRRGSPSPRTAPARPRRRREAGRRVLNADSDAGGDAGDAAREGIESLVEAVHGHARTLALLAPSLRSRGVEGARAALVELMAETAQAPPAGRSAAGNPPGDRKQSAVRPCG
jgi:hypothetical protein